MPHSLFSILHSPFSIFHSCLRFFLDPIIFSENQLVTTIFGWLEIPRFARNATSFVWLKYAAVQGQAVLTSGLRFLASLGMTTQHVAKYAAAVNAVLSFCPCAAATSVNGQRVIPNAVRNLELSVTNFYINYPDFAKQNQVEWKFIYINYPDFAKQNHPFKI